jgi:hypothetical protein
VSLVVGVGSVAAPTAVYQTINNPSTERVSVDIAGELQQVGIIFNDNLFVSALEEENISSLIPSSEIMLQSSFIFYSPWSCHIGGL